MIEGILGRAYDQFPTQEMKHMNCILVTQELPASTIVVIGRNTPNAVVKISGGSTRLLHLHPRPTNHSLAKLLGYESVFSFLNERW